MWGGGELLRAEGGCRCVMEGRGEAGVVTC